MSETTAMAQGDVEEVDALPVLAGPGEVAPPHAPPRALVTRTPGQVAAQAAAVAVTGFAAGALVTAVARRSKAAKIRPRARKELGGMEVLATRTFLVDVHLLGGRE